MLTRRAFLFLAAPLYLTPVLGAEGRSKKKGYCSMNPQDAEKLQATWHYNWGPNGTSKDATEFVPMVKGTPHFRPGYWEQIAQLKAKGAKHLLGFNEPERDSQGNLTIEQALELWPKLEATGLRLGSPAPSSDGKGMKWLDEFMKEAKKRKLRVDFIAVHWYRSSSLAAFEGWLKELKRDYGRPVWLTEFNVWKGDQRTQESFLKGAAKIMERLSFVERYTYFDPGRGKPGGLFNPDGSLSALGEFYRDL
jgi:hypothetical protein